MRVDDFAPDDIVHAFEVTGLEPKPGFVYHNGCGCALGALMCLEMGHLPVTFGQAMGISHAEEILGLTSLQAWAIGDGWAQAFVVRPRTPPSLPTLSSPPRGVSMRCLTRQDGGYDHND